MSAEQAPLMILWSRIWSPLVDEELRTSAWQALDLPDHYETHKADYWSTFHAGMPEPPVPLVLHSALRQEGSGVREAWLRVINHLGLGWNDVHLPPDQLGAACEVYACVIERSEPVLIDELRDRYLQPWCDVAEQMLTESHSKLLPLVQSFSQDLKAIVLPDPPRPD